MHIFDRIQAEELEGRELHLSLLTAAIIIILAAGLALLMYPAVFSHSLIVTGRTLRIAFFGFCALAVLLVGYLLDRQMTIQRLRRQLVAELQRNVAQRREASADLLGTLPHLSNFQDRLAMEFRRAASLERPLSLLVIALTPSPEVSDEGEVTAAFGDAAKAMARKLRAEDSVYLFCSGIFGVVIPGADTVTARHMAERLAEGLRDAAGVSGRFTFEIRVFNYPEHATTARELEEAVSSLLPENFRELILAGATTSR